MLLDRSSKYTELTCRSGGSAGAVYAFIFAWTGTACCFSVLSELASMLVHGHPAERAFILTYPRAPTSGGQYHWCAMLAPTSCMKFLSYITGRAFRNSPVSNNLTLQFRLGCRHWMAGCICFCYIPGRNRNPRCCHSRSQKVRCQSLARHVDYVGLSSNCTCH